MAKYWCMVAAVAAFSGTVRAAEVNLPVTRVTSFNSGVAYYEHNGTVAGEAQVLLKFKADQINDILKSLVVLNLTGQGGVNVSYASQEPLARALKSFSVDISANPSLGDLLGQVRGAEVTLVAPDSIAGKIVGVEKRTQRVLPADVLVEKEYLNVATADGLRSIPLESISTIRLADPKLNDELNKALALLAEARDSDRKSVHVNFTGDGERAVRIGYINEAPIWKTSYRLVLGEKARATQPAEGAATRLQGWAIVENTSDFDWQDVDLTLVAGRPISFVQDLYTPLYVPRPVVKPELYASLQPRVYEEGMVAEARQLAAAEAAPDGAGGRGGAAPRLAERMARAAPAPAAPKAYAGYAAEDAALTFDAAGHNAALQQGVQAMASGQAVGELFSYHIATPVTLPRRKSAMLPIVNQGVQARKVSIYNQGVLAKNPLNGVWLTNDTGLSLLAGPVTVFDGGAYAGDARLDNVSAGEKRLLSYAIDLEMAIDPTAKSTQRIVAAKIVRGVLNLTRRDEYTQVYAIRNKAAQERVLVVEHPRDASRKLLQPTEPAEQTPSLYRFEVSVPAARDGKPAAAELTVLEEQVHEQTMAILPFDVGTVLGYASNKQIPPKVREALAEAARRMQALAEARQQLARTQEQIAAQQKERGQLPPVMNALERSGQAYKTYERKLLAIEDRLEQLTRQRDEQTAKVTELEQSLADYVNGLSVE